MPECVFCRILAGELPASVVYRDEEVAAFLDIHPINPGHVLVVPTRHAVSLGVLDPTTGGRLFQVGQRLAAAIRASELRCEGINFWLADGAAAGQDVFHLHLHVLPRWRGDGFGLRLPRHHGRPVPRVELDRIARAIRNAT